MRKFECIEPNHKEYADYSPRFKPYNQKESGWHNETYSLVLRDDERIIAGGRGHIYLGALEIRRLWVDKALRGESIGSDLMKAIEEKARRRGASKARLYTYSWQAEIFYKNHGYDAYAKFDFPKRHYRIDMQKFL